MMRQYLKEERIMTKHLVCQCMVNAWEKLPTYYVEDSFSYLTMEDRWQGGSLYDLFVMHTCKYNSSTPMEQKKLILEELIKTATRDLKNKPLVNYVLESFHNDKIVSLDHRINYVKSQAVFDDITNDDDDDDTIHLIKLSTRQSIY